jgi:hypothetical protein
MFCNKMQCSLLKVPQLFGAAYLHLQGQIISQAANQHEAGRKQAEHCRFFDLENEADMFL